RWFGAGFARDRQREIEPARSLRGIRHCLTLGKVANGEQEVVSPQSLCLERSRQGRSSVGASEVNSGKCASGLSHNRVALAEDADALIERQRETCSSSL